MKDNRKVTNIFIRTNLALKFGKLVLGAWVVALIANIGGNYFVYNSLSNTITEQMGAAANEKLSGDLSLFLTEVIAINVLTFTVLVWIVLAFLTIMNHRIFGPVESLKDFIGHLKSGNYDPPKRALREKDELVTLMDELNSLADTLKEKDWKESQVPGDIL
jgi:HAMP domain-containing protein